MLLLRLQVYKLENPFKKGVCRQAEYRDVFLGAGLQGHSPIYAIRGSPNDEHGDDYQ